MWLCTSAVESRALFLLPANACCATHARAQELELSLLRARLDKAQAHHLASFPLCSVSSRVAVRLHPPWPVLVKAQRRRRCFDFTRSHPASSRCAPPPWPQGFHYWQTNKQTKNQPLSPPALSLPTMFHTKLANSHIVCLHLLTKLPYTEPTPLAIHLPRIVHQDLVVHFGVQATQSPHWRSQYNTTTSLSATFYHACLYQLRGHHLWRTVQPSRRPQKPLSPLQQRTLLGCLLPPRTPGEHIGNRWSPGTYCTF
jgi:hypothetical protein